MRMSSWLAALALGLACGSGAMAGGIFSLNPFASSSTAGPNTASSSTLTQAGATMSGLAPVTQATFPSPGQGLAGPSRLINLLPSLHSISNIHVIGYSVYPTQTDQYLAQFGFQRIR